MQITKPTSLIIFGGSPLGPIIKTSGRMGVELSESVLAMARQVYTIAEFS